MLLVTNYDVKKSLVLGTSFCSIDYNAIHMKTISTNRRREKTHIFNRFFAAI